MTTITHEDFQLARRISKTIQQYLEFTNNNGARSTDVYDFLTNKGVIEKDRYQGLNFRKFLFKLKENDLLKLIPQCSYSYSENGMHEWRFYKLNKNALDLPTKPNNENASHREHFPDLSTTEIDYLIQLAKPHVAKLPKRKDEFTPQQLETRQNYKRAYEFWSSREDEILIRGYHKFKRVDKIAQLLERQPSAVDRRLIELGVKK